MKARETAPERIWLQCISPNRFDWTWHSEPIGEDELEEVEYVRADLHRSREREALESVRSFLVRIDRRFEEHGFNSQYGGIRSADDVREALKIIDAILSEGGEG
jgi:hypothetical protein